MTQADSEMQLPQSPPPAHVADDGRNRNELAPSSSATSSSSSSNATTAIHAQHEMQQRVEGQAPGEIRAIDLPADLAAHQEHNHDSPPSSSSSSSSSSIGEDRITGFRDVIEAVALTWRKQKDHLFVSWIHVPLGIMFLLVVTWGFRLAMDLAPFRFPAPVLAMMLFFALLLLLDFLSTKFPGQAPQDTEKTAMDATSTVRSATKRRRFVDPFMKLLAPPCDFCLRNMSVMFTPSFVLIPAREVIPGKEIGLIAAWFTVSQVLAFVFPVLLTWGIEWCLGATKSRRKSLRRTGSKTPSQYHRSRNDSVATLAGVDYEKGISFVGGYKLGAVATGLSGLTAHMLAPITHLTVKLDDDEMRQIQATAMEHARQQGDPAVTSDLAKFRWSDFRPISDVSTYEHRSMSPHHHDRSRPSRSRSRNSSHRSPRLGSASPSGSPMPTPSAEYKFPGPNTPSAIDAVVASTADGSMQRSIDSHLSAQGSVTTANPVPVIIAQPPEAFEEQSRGRRSRTTYAQARESSHEDEIAVIEEVEEDLEKVPTAVNSRRHSGLLAPVESRRGSKISFDVKTKLAHEPAPDFGAKAAVVDKDYEQDEQTRRNSEAVQSVISSEGPKPDAVERLSLWLSDLITPTIYSVLFIVGLPLFFVLDIALPLFLAINLLTFIAAITIVPPKVRRFLHPILSCSIATVLIIWAFAAMKGIGLSTCLNRFYSVDAKYNVLWDPSGYKGPIPGAGDVLFSTLDAGIVALAVPMYRYRKELKENFCRMMVVLIPCAALSLFVWPLIAAKFGMDRVRSLAFAARFMSTPLAIELAGNIEADESITVILVVITGIVAAILKDHFFRLMRVDREDHLMIGITMGSTSGAIGASSLISTPRVMAVASLAFVLFGAILLIATAIPPIVTIVQQLAS